MNRYRFAIIGGGLGGLLTAYLLEKQFGEQADVTLFESSDRVGGKIVTGRFANGPRYEAGAAELYDYSQLGADPLRELVRELGLTTVPISGDQIAMNGRVVRGFDDTGTGLGQESRRALAAFRRVAREAISPREYYESDWQADRDDALSRQTFAALLETVPDAAARHYIKTVSHSDLACEPSQTSAMYGLQNYLMDEPDYMQLYTVVGGIEALPRALASRLSASMRLAHRVESVGKIGEKYRLQSRCRDQVSVDEFDFVVAALPNNWLNAIRWEGPALAAALAAHHDFYNHPAHYLRVTLQFKNPFWRSVIGKNYFMLDAFGGCCVYDEGLHCAGEQPAVLGFLLAGDAALNLGNLTDEELTRAVLAELPRALGAAGSLLIESRVHRWLGAVNAWPGGHPAREPESRHQPEPVDHPNFFVVGDYLFDSTLNGVVDSAQLVAEWIAEELAPESVT